MWCFDHGDTSIQNYWFSSGVGGVFQKSMSEKFFPIFFFGKINFLTTYQGLIFGFLRRGNKKISGRFVPFRDSVENLYCFFLNYILLNVIITYLPFAPVS